MSGWVYELCANANAPTSQYAWTHSLFLYCPHPANSFHHLPSLPVRTVYHFKRTYKSVDLNAPFFFIYIFGNTITFYRVLEIVELLWRNSQHSFHVLFTFFLRLFSICFHFISFVCVCVRFFLFSIHTNFMCLSCSAISLSFCGCLCEHMTSNSFIDAGGS